MSRLEFRMNTYLKQEITHAMEVFYSNLKRSKRREKKELWSRIIENTSDKPHYYYLNHYKMVIFNLPQDEEESYWNDKAKDLIKNMEKAVKDYEEDVEHRVSSGCR